MSAEDLARRAVACKGFHWMPGALDEDGFRLVAKLPDGLWLWARGDDRKRTSSGSGAGADLADPATLGCFEHGLLPAAWGPGVQIVIDMTMGGAWVARVRVVVGGDDPIRTFEGCAGSRNDALAEALVTALEASPS